VCSSKGTPDVPWHNGTMASPVQDWLRIIDGVKDRPCTKL